jgi:AcrR family transcriptional regulator
MDRDERRREILRVATRLFRDRPYSEVSVNDIAEAAGVAKGLLHHYFGSKRELYLEVVREVAALPMVSALEASREGEPGPAVLERGVDGFLALVAQNPELWLASVTVGGAESDDEVASILDDGKEVLADQTIAALGLSDEKDDPILRGLMRGYGGFVQELTIEWLGRGRLTEVQVRTAMLETLPLLVAHVLPLLRAIPPETTPARRRRSRSAS